MVRGDRHQVLISLRWSRSWLHPGAGSHCTTVYACDGSRSASVGRRSSHLTRSARTLSILPITVRRPRRRARATDRALKRSASAMSSNQWMRSPWPRAMSRSRRTVSSSQLSRCARTSLMDQRSWVRGRRTSRAGSRATNDNVDSREATMRRTASRRHLVSEADRRVAMTEVTLDEAPRRVKRPAASRGSGVAMTSPTPMT